MRKLTFAVLCVLAFAWLADAGEPKQIPFSETGSQIITDVEAVLAGFTLSDDQAQKVEQAKQEFSETRGKLLAELTGKFTKDVGKPEDVFAKLADANFPNDEKLALKARIDKFASAEGAGFRSSIALLEGALRRGISRELKRDEDKFKVELTRRQALRETPLGAYIVKIQDGLPSLKLSAEQQQKVQPLLDSLKAGQEQSMKDYVDTFTRELGGDAEKIRKSGTPEEKAGLDEKITVIRAKLQEDLQKKAAVAIQEFGRAAKGILSAEQQAALRVMSDEKKNGPD